MGVLDAFMSTWSNARATFGAGTPQDGAAFDGSSTLRRLQEQVGAAAPGRQWTGTAADAYAAVNTEHGRVLGALADLDRRLREQVDQSARLVSTGRESLDATRRWVTDAAATVPPTAAGERMLVPIVQKGVAEVIDTVTRSNSDLNAVGARIAALGEEYRALGIQKFGGGDGPGDTPGDQQPEPENKYEKALREAGLLDEEPTGYYREWLENAERQGVPPDTIVDIARRHDITPASFEVLGGMQRVKDPDGKSFFQLPKGTSGEDARKAVLMTYILNAGTDYGDNPTTDFTPEPYNADEVQRIIDRQNANSWTYDEDVPFILGADGALMTTPNGMLMGMGGNWVQDQFSWKGGTAWGDIFMENIDHGNNPSQQLRQIIESGTSWNVGADGTPRAGSLDLDRLLHHEEMHSRQWADKGYFGMLWAAVTDSDGIEKEAGLGDGGYT
ncbi:EspA/EspE family type VII secretion system effector [Mycobacterium sp. Root265]|uniref:EspA/EspE family type VII secretion system effector n=1 Tax=Mycobacterium sp. Root265 TaxID=1736504 RepID=UPI001F178D4E|nr:EspA/EspE family type VII secretion system effector [Mycobacterium sp. Root265]